MDQNQTNNTKLNAQVLEPGLVIVRGLLTAHDEERMAREVWTWGNDTSNGFFKDGVPNATQGRGRMFDAAERFPTWLKDICNAAVAEARRIDPEMPPMDYTHLLVNCYMSSDGLQWHRDCYENDGKSDHPVVNLTLGAACTFAWKHEVDDPEKTVVLESGDFILFGGPCRLMLHKVKEILLDNIPPWMRTFEPGPVRFSITFRDAPEVRGREEEFKYFKFSASMKEQEAFNKMTKEERARMARAYQDEAERLAAERAMTAPGGA